MSHFQEPRLDNYTSKYEFTGSDYVKRYDHVRLTGQIQRIFELMLDERWRTLHEISVDAKAPEASVSAQLRHLRKTRYGAHTINKRRRGDPHQGLFEYQLVVNPYTFRWSRQDTLETPK